MKHLPGIKQYVLG